MNGIPLSLKDFFAYFIPGSLMSIHTLLILALSNEKLQHSLSNIKLLENNGIVLLFFIFSYAIGYIIPTPLNIFGISLNILENEINNFKNKNKNNEILLNIKDDFHEYSKNSNFDNQKFWIIYRRIILSNNSQMVSYLERIQSIRLLTQKLFFSFGYISAFFIILLIYLFYNYLITNQLKNYNFYLYIYLYSIFTFFLSFLSYYKHKKTCNWFIRSVLSTYTEIKER